MTITLGWWILPALITIVMIIFTTIKGKSHGSFDLMPIIILLFSISLISVSWLIWAILK